MAALLVWPNSVYGQQQLWIDRSIISEKLEDDYSETPAGMGLAANGGIVELFASPGGTTWTLILTMPDGKSKVIVTGEGWITLPIKIAGSES